MKLLPAPFSPHRTGAAPRRRSSRLCSALILGWIPLLAASPRADLGGAWVTQITPDNPTPQLLVFEHRGGAWTGRMTSRFGTLTLENVVFDGEQLSFSEVFDLGLSRVRPVRAYGELRGEELHLRIPILTGSGFWGDQQPISGFRMRVAHRTNTAGAAALQDITPRNQSLSPLPSNALGRRPPMGWSSWNHFEDKIDDQTVRQMADAIVLSGLREAGYIYINIDDGWQDGRDKKGALVPNARFPDMRALADYVHARGLKLGIYSAAGTQTCANYIGSYGHEEQDAQTFAKWGVDALKYDWCDAADGLYSTPAEMQAAYWRMGKALQATGRPIFYVISQYGLFNVAQWAGKVGANAWRTTFDISDQWSRIDHIALQQIGREADAGPGGWNDMDGLEVGNGGMTLEECRTQMTLWSMLNSPLILGNDVRNMTAQIQALVANREVISVNQDPLGISAVALRETSELWTKPLSNGDVAVALINHDDAPSEKQLSWSMVGLPKVVSVRDLWQHTYLSGLSDVYRVVIPAHGAVLLRASSKPSVPE